MRVGLAPAPKAPTNGAPAVVELQNGSSPQPPPGALQMATADAPGGSSGGRSTIYRIDSDGVVTQIWRSSNDVVHALHLEPDGSLIAGTGQRGRLYRIKPEEQTQPQPGVIPVDLQRLSFGPCSEDLADALHHFCRSDRALARKFLQRHLDDAA